MVCHSRCIIHLSLTSYGLFTTVGPKYILHEHVGGGSYGDVCRATDLETNQTVALKRVPNVLCCPLLAKRVLREVCIMRRLSHPHIILLTDVFTYPSLEVGGGLDLYIATEFADGGDMYHLKKPVSASDIKLLLWQLLMGVNYLHSCRVWHRDIKSENILLTSSLHVKICDFGLSRSAEEAASEFDSPQVSVSGKSMPMKKALTRQYTKMVVTPSYRAPEVIMSRGQYDSTIDIWSIGCIFWELLVRSVNPQNCGTLANPLFGVRGEPTTPEAGEKYAKDAHSPLAEQLNVIFDVIGTPCWKDIESIPSESWRAYLKGLPGRAGNLARNLVGLVDDEAIDLLTRMLSFDPARRCTAEEALSHAYFRNIKRPAESKQLFSEDLTSAIASGSLWKIKDPSVALAQLEIELEASERDHDGGKTKLIMLLDSEVQQQQHQNLMQRSFLCSLATAKLQLLQQREAAALTPQMVLVDNQILALPSQPFLAPSSQNGVIPPDVNVQEINSCVCDSCTKLKENHRTINGVLKRAKNAAENQEPLQHKLVLDLHTGAQVADQSARPKRARAAPKLQKIIAPKQGNQASVAMMKSAENTSFANVMGTASGLARSEELLHHRNWSKKACSLSLCWLEQSLLAIV
ncbi:hypothetical protein GOP47_0024846 [Adiantum capillus-veneris]|uniref:Protein kinase domain-containing protein n=1 Tax=Adiantum capillus-veneris TaxID=13818 RepID=A0A9D4U2I8_ADICA|nr:hypothetical protein GOP47_0024846 [Adiantum capillus-veneris]